MTGYDNPGTKRAPARRRRGLGLFGVSLAMAVLALVAVEWARWQDRIVGRADAEALASELAHHAWALDHWLHAGGQAAHFRPAASAPEAPRQLNPADLTALLDPAGGHAAPWIDTDLRLSTDPAGPPPGSDWHLRFAVGWPVSATPASAGFGPPHGILVAMPQSDRARLESRLVRSALIRRGTGVAISNSVGGPTPDDLARALAIAAGISMADEDIAVPAWLYGRIPPELALRMARAGREAPGMSTDLTFAAGSSIRQPAGATAIISAGSAEFRTIGPLGSNLDLASGELVAGSVDVGANLGIAGSMTVDNASASRLRAASWINAGLLTATGQTTVEQFSGTGTVNSGRIEAESMSATESGAGVGTVLAGPVSSRHHAAITEIEEVGNLFAAGGMMIGDLLHGSAANARSHTFGPSGICYGCLATATSTECADCL